MATEDQVKATKPEAPADKTAVFLKALLDVQHEMPGLQKKSINPHFGNKYVSLESLTDVVLPVLHKHGFVWVTFPTTIDGEPALRYNLIHTPSGESIGDTMKLDADKTGPQGQGSAITYARRYVLMAILSLVADPDEDGEKAQAAVEAPISPLNQQNIYAMLKRLNISAPDYEKKLGKEISKLTNKEAQDIIAKLKASVMRLTTEEA